MSNLSQTKKNWPRSRNLINTDRVLLAYIPHGTGWRITDHHHHMLVVCAGWFKLWWQHGG